jgi:hypothetical protein
MQKSIAFGRLYRLKGKRNLFQFQKNILQKPSAVSIELSSQADKKNSPWRAKLSDGQYETGMEVLEAFGFGELYKNNSPDIKAIASFSAH